MAPAIFQFFRLSATMPTRASLPRYGIVTVFAGLSYVAAVAARDAIYWPIVVQVYS